MENKFKEELKEIVERHEKVCSNLIGGFEYKRLVAELRELLNKNNKVNKSDILKEESKWVDITTMQMGKTNRKSWMNLCEFAKSVLLEIVGLLLMKQSDMEFLMKNFVSTNGVYANKRDISRR